MYVYSSGGWQAAGSSVNGTSDRNTYTATAGQTVFAATYDTGYVDVYLNGVKLIAGTDFTATNGTSITLTTGAAVNDVVDIVAYGTFVLADHYTKLQSDARYVEVAGDTMTGDLNVTGTVTADGLTVDTDAYRRLLLTYPDAFTSKLQIGFSNFYVQGSATNDRLTIANNSSGQTHFENQSKTSMVIDNSGDISFYEDTGTTPKFFWDASAESLGIGTSSPSNLLHVEGAFTDTTQGVVANFDSGNAGIGSGPIVKWTNDFAEAAVTMLNTASGSSALTFETMSSSSLAERTSGLSNLQFADTADGNIGMLQYDHTSNYLLFQVNNAERMRIDSSGRLLHGKTTSGDYVTGTEIQPAGAILSYRAGGVAAIHGRTDEGEIIRLTSNSSIVGSIGVDNTDNLTISGNSSHCGLNFSTDDVNPYKNGAYTNGTTSLGSASTRFKDLHLSGTVNSSKTQGGTAFYASTAGSYIQVNGSSSNAMGFGMTGGNSSPATAASTSLGFHHWNNSSWVNPVNITRDGIAFNGDTAEANALDDYEEGTFTPTSPTVSFSASTGSYTKIGRQVFYEIDVTLPSTSSGVQFLIDGMPFSNASKGGAFIKYTTNGTVITFNNNAGTRISAFNLDSSITTLASVSGRRFSIVGQYFVA
jgi:hypothetical protein